MISTGKKILNITLSFSLSGFSLPSFAQEVDRPVLVSSVIEIELGGDGERFGQWNREHTKYRCEYGCGPHRSSDGNGYGNGANAGPPASSGGDGTKGSSGDHRDSRFHRSDQERSLKTEESAWRDYQDQVAHKNTSVRESLRLLWQKEDIHFYDDDLATLLLQRGKPASSQEDQYQSSEDFIDRAMPSQLKNHPYLPLRRDTLGGLVSDAYQSHHKEELSMIRHGYLAQHPKSPQAKEAYRAGLFALKEADQAYLQGFIKAGEYFEKSARLLLDVVSDLNPMTALTKDLYRVFVGKDPVTGLPLSAGERLIFGGLSILGVVTLGESSLLEAGLGRMVKLVNASAGEANTVLKIFSQARAMAHAAGVNGREALKNFLSIVQNDVGAVGDIGFLLQSVNKHGLWSKGQYKKSVQNAFSHFKKHRTEFPELKNGIEYVEAAHDFITSPPLGTLSKTRANGERILYSPTSDVFVVQSVDGAPKTMFKPNPAVHGYKTNKEYYDAQ